MNDLKITDVRMVSGDSAFLLDDGTTSILYDTGFGFTGHGIARKVAQELGSRELDYIFLTHSHYDHALGSAYILQRYPQAKVVAGSYARKIFAKPSARSAIRDMDRKAAAAYGVGAYEDLSGQLRVDIAVEDGDILECGDLHITVVALPGHTRCSVGFFLQEHGLLLGTETLGVYFGKDTYLPSYLVGYDMTLASFRKARALDCKSILLPHYGVVHGQEAATYLDRSEQVAVETAETVCTMLKAGVPKEQILEHFKQVSYRPHVLPTYPPEAFALNTRIMIDLIERELCQ